MEAPDGNFIETLFRVHNDLSSGLLYTHTRINDNTKKTLEAASFLYVLIEILNEKGLLSIEELDERKKQVAERLVKKFTESGIGLIYRILNMTSTLSNMRLLETVRVDCTSARRYAANFLLPCQGRMLRKGSFDGILVSPI